MHVMRRDDSSERGRSARLNLETATAGSGSPRPEGSIRYSLLLPVVSSAPTAAGALRQGSRVMEMSLGKATVIGAVVVGLLGIVGAVLNAELSHGSSGPTPPTPSASRQTPQSRPPTNTNRSTAPSPRTSFSVYWRGSFALNPNSDGLDFDSYPPSSGDQTNINYLGNELQASANAQLARWTQPGTPSASECASWIATHPGGGVPFPAGGMLICIKTDQGRYGLLRIESSANGQVSGIAKIWNL